MSFCLTWEPRAGELPTLMMPSRRSMNIYNQSGNPGGTPWNGAWAARQPAEYEDTPGGMINAAVRRGLRLDSLDISTFGVSSLAEAQRAVDEQIHLIGHECTDACEQWP